MRIGQHGMLGQVAYDDCYNSVCSSKHCWLNNVTDDKPTVEDFIKAGIASIGGVAVKPKVNLIKVSRVAA